MTTTVKQRVEELEIKYAYHEETLEALDKVISRQQQQLDTLEGLCRELLERVRASSVDNAVSGTAEAQRPPHY